MLLLLDSLEVFMPDPSFSCKCVFNTLPVLQWRD